MIRQLTLGLTVAVSVLLIAACSGFADFEQDVETFTSASVRNYYPPAAGFEELAEIVFHGVVVVSTTNPDGSPNAAVLIPTIFEEQYVIMRMAPNQTAANIKRDGRAVITVFVPKNDQDAKAAYEDVRRYGARLTCVVMEKDEEYEAVLDRWNESVTNELHRLKEGHPILRIVEIKPVG